MTREAEAHNAMGSTAPGLATPWPNPNRWPVTRRLLALWRWEWERGPHSTEARNARRSIVNRTAALGADVFDVEEDFRKACADLVHAEDFVK